MPHLKALPVCILTVLLAGEAIAASPRLTMVLPHGGQRGTEVDVQFQGSNLQDAQELMLYDRGVEVVSLEAPADANGALVKARLRIAADCPLGTQRLRIRTATGLSDLQNFHVGPFPVMEEAEPNTEFNSPQPVPLNTTIHGRIDSEDVDHFAVECKQGDRLSVEVFAERLGIPRFGYYFDPYIAILDSRRFELAVSDDHALAWNDGVLSVIVPEDGTYIVQIRDASYAGDGLAYYLLHIGTFPRPLSIVPSGGRPGETLTVTFRGDPAGDFERQITVPETPLERFGIEAEDERGVAPSLHPFRISDLDNVIEVEPNSTPAEATAGPAPAAFNGVIGEPGDVDYFRFPAKQGQVFDIEAYARRSRSPLDSVVYVCNADGGILAGNDDSRGPDSYFRWQAPADGDYLILIKDHLDAGSPEHAYRVEVTPVQPKLVASTVDFERYVQPQIVVPQGGGRGVQVSVNRQDVGGPVNFTGEGLPDGVSVECPEGWRNDGVMPVVFYAAPEAPLAGSYSKVSVGLADPNQPNLQLAGPLKQDVLMILGENQVYVWTEEILRLPVVVSQAAPFQVRIEEPRVPLVRGGSMNLKVVAERTGDYTGPIQVLLLQNPPGVGSAGSVQIPEGQTEALIPVNANGDAPVRVSEIAVRAIATVGNGVIETCSPAVPLAVEEPYVTLEFHAAAVEQGKETPLLVTVTKRKDFDGEAQTVLYGLPPNAVAEPLKLTHDTQELVFTIKAPPETPAGNNQNLFCQILIPENGDQIVHNLGTGRLRVDPPPPMPVAQSEPAPMAEPMPEAAPPRPLSRLEQLRLEQKKRDEAQRSGEGG
ncbi:MAG: PPC domain-containing protein [Planctomyces sp.]|nr:PPC domain-containing protein [Planctomyces sp.]